MTAGRSTPSAEAYRPFPHRQDHNHRTPNFQERLARCRPSPPIESKSDCRHRPIMVHTPPPEHRRSLQSSDDAWKHYGFSRPRHPSNTMKNFVRLVQFAWRYKVRFGLSVACAAMVALLFFTELGAVYPLLHILFDSQNPQRWISEKIAGLETDILVARQPGDRSRSASLTICRADSRAATSSTSGIRSVNDDFDTKEKDAAQARAPGRRRRPERERRSRRPSRDRPARKPAARPSRGRSAAEGTARIARLVPAKATPRRWRSACARSSTRRPTKRNS